MVDVVVEDYEKYEMNKVAESPAINWPAQLKRQGKQIKFCKQIRFLSE